MQRGRPLVPLELTSQEKLLLENWARRRSDSCPMAERARMILACAKGLPNRRVAAELGVTPQTVGKWRSKFRKGRLLGVFGSAHLEHSADVKAEHLTRIAELLHQGPPVDRDFWTTRALAAATSFSQSKVSRILRGLALLPQHELVADICRSGLGLSGVGAIAGVILDRSERVFALVASPGHSNGDGVRSDAGAMESLRLQTCSLVAELERRTALNLSNGSPHPSPHLFAFFDQLESAAPATSELHFVASGNGAGGLRLIQKRVARMQRSVLHVVPSGIPWFHIFKAWIDFFEIGADPEPQRPFSELIAAIQRFLLSGLGTISPFMWVRRYPGASAPKPVPCEAALSGSA